LSDCVTNISQTVFSFQIGVKDESWNI